MIIPRTPSKTHLITLLLADFRKFNSKTEDIRTMLESNGIQPYCYDRNQYTSIPFQYVVPADCNRSRYTATNAETDPEMIYYWFSKTEKDTILVVASPVEAINHKYDYTTNEYIDESKSLWKYAKYTRGCSSFGYEDSVQKIINRCR